MYNEDTTKYSSLRFASNAARSIGAPLEDAPAWTVNAADEACEDDREHSCPACCDLPLDEEGGCLCLAHPKVLLTQVSTREL